MAPPPLRRRRLGWIVWLVVIAAIGFGARKYLASRGPAAIAVRVYRVTHGTVRDLVSSVATGRVAARHEATLRAEIAGRVFRLEHRRGQSVHAGDALVTYEPSELRDRVRVAETAVALARAQGDQSAVSLRIAAANAARANGLRARGAIAPADADGLQGQADVARCAVDAARTTLAQATANALLARDALQKAVLRAPFDGVVLTTNIEEGEATAPGTPLITLADTSELHVDAELDESDLGRVAVGMSSEVSLDAFPTQRFRGTLSEIAPSVTRDARGTRSIAIRVTLESDPRLRVGMSADVDVIVATRNDVLSIPPNAVIGRGTDRAVLVAQGGIARRHTIDVGIATWEAIEVSRGIREGDRVIVTLASQDLVDGAHVDVRGEEVFHANRELSAR